MFFCWKSVYYIPATRRLQARENMNLLLIRGCVWAVLLCSYYLVCECDGTFPEHCCASGFKEEAAQAANFTHWLLNSSYSSNHKQTKCKEYLLSEKQKPGDDAMFCFLHVSAPNRWSAAVLWILIWWHLLAGRTLESDNGRSMVVLHISFFKATRTSHLEKQMSPHVSCEPRLLISLDAGPLHRRSPESRYWHCLETPTLLFIPVFGTMLSLVSSITSVFASFILQMASRDYKILSSLCALFRSQFSVSLLSKPSLK
jgi:hypothetical protein